MVRAILSGAKTQTRRIVNPRLHLIVDGDETTGRVVEQSAAEFGALATELAKCPFVAPGDRLWVQEAHTFTLAGGYWVRIVDHATNVQRSVEVTHDVLEKLREQKTVRNGTGRPGRFMPRWASRTMLEVTGKRLERLQDISEADAKAEGVGNVTGPPLDRSLPWFGRDDWWGPVHAFHDLWDSINGADPAKAWAANPWVWCVEFRRVT